ncbi:MAG: hypothetical protein ACQEQD_07130 [Bacillota bacterium]
MYKNNIFLIIFLLVLIFALTITPIKAKDLNEEDLLGKWQGKIRVNNQQLEIIIDFFQTSQGIKGTIEIPSQNIVDYQLKKINYEDNKISFELPAEETGKFNGEISSQEIVGNYIQENLKGKFHLIKEREKELKEETKKENQNNKEKNIETKPDNDPPYPALLIFSDFGKEDEKTIKTYQMLKDLYLQKGYAIFHYENNDFKFTKNIEKENFNYNELVNNAINYIEKISVNPTYNEIHILGESQGALLSLAAVQKSKIDIKSFVLLDPPTNPASKIILNQLSGLQNDLFAETRYIINKLENGEKVSEVSKELKTFFAPEIQPFLISWFDYEPLKYIDNNTKPILIVERKNKKIPDSLIQKDNIRHLLIEQDIFNKEENTESIYLNEKFRKEIEDFINL